MVKGYNIAIIPTPAVNHDAELISEFISSKEEVCFVLDQATRFPHISLYHVALEEASIKKVSASIRRITESFGAFKLASKGYHLLEGKWIDVSYELDSPLLKLHTTVLGAVAPLRVRKSDVAMKEQWSDASPARQENLELYGWSEARDLFRPHLTLTRLRGRVGEDFLETFPAKDFSFEAHTIGLYELGEYGTCTKLLAEYTLEPINI